MGRSVDCGRHLRHDEFQSSCQTIVALGENLPNSKTARDEESAHASGHVVDCPYPPDEFLLLVRAQSGGLMGETFPGMLEMEIWSDANLTADTRHALNSRGDSPHYAAADCADGTRSTLSCFKFRRW